MKKTLAATIALASISFTAPAFADGGPVVSAPVEPVGQLANVGLGGSGLVAAGVATAALIGFVAIVASDDDDAVAATTTTN